MRGQSNQELLRKREAEKAASKILNAWWDYTLPVQVNNVAHRMGIALVPQQLKVSSYYLTADHPSNLVGSPAIVFNTQGPISWQRLAIAQCIGHHVLGHGSTYRANSALPTEAEQQNENVAEFFATRLLIPDGAIRLMISQGFTTTEQLAAAFGVSTMVMSYRLIELGTS
jgi:Zn-dependent peptidase ImmA (M78 family)